MSRRKPDAGRSSTTAVPQRAVAGTHATERNGSRVAIHAGVPAPSEHQSGRWLPLGLLVAIIAAVAWWLTLLALAVFTANPITLNRDQIQRAQFVVTGTIDDLEGGKLSVARAWKRNADLGQVTVANLHETGGKQGETYIVPLSRNMSGDYFVTPPRGEDEPPLIYPAEADALEQLEAILP